LQPKPTETQIKAWDSLAQRLFNRDVKVKKKGEEEEEEEEISDEFDVMACRHVILHEGRISKQSKKLADKILNFLPNRDFAILCFHITGLHSVVTHTSKRYMFLLNDYLLITAVVTSTAISLVRGSDRYKINQAVRLDKIAMRDLIYSEEESRTSFEILTPTRSYILIAETESEKRIWQVTCILCSFFRAFHMFYCSYWILNFLISAEYIFSGWKNLNSLCLPSISSHRRQEFPDGSTK